MKKTLQKIILLTTFALCGWNNAANGQSSPTESGKKMHISHIAMYDNNIFAGTSSDGIFLSSDGGETFAPINNGLPKQASVTGLVVNGTNIFVAFYNGVFLSTNNGTNWTAVNKGLGDNEITTLTKFKNGLFLGTKNGLFTSTDNGLNWNALLSEVKDEVRNVVVTDNNILVYVFKGYYDRVYYSSSDGLQWKMVKGLESLNIDKVEAHGNYMYATFCSYKESPGKCRSNALWVLNENGKKWNEIMLDSRYFLFEGDTVCAITAKVVEGKNQEYSFKIVVSLSKNGGKNWKELDEKTDPFIAAHSAIQEKLTDLLDDGYNEMKSWKHSAEGLVKMKQQAKEIKKRLKEHNRAHPTTLFYGPSISSGRSSPDYRQLSNDRFKEMNNHRDSWLDSGGKIHIH